MVYEPKTLVAEDNRLNIALEKLCNEENVADIATRETAKDVMKLSEFPKIRLYIAGLVILMKKTQAERT